MRTLAGFVSIFVYHIPRVLILYLQVLYLKARYGDQETLTASPAEHLRRARGLLRKDNSHLLYAAIEIRFALERLAQRELLFNETTSLRDVSESSPVKKIRALRRAAPDSAYPHRIVLVNPTTGERTDFDSYIPLNEGRANKLDGRLGALLHPKEGLNLGLIGDPWYREQRRLLREAIDYLEPIAKSIPFSVYDGIDNMTLVRTESGPGDATEIGHT